VKATTKQCEWRQCAKDRMADLQLFEVVSTNIKSIFEQFYWHLVLHQLLAAVDLVGTHKWVA